MYFFYFDESGSRDTSVGTAEKPKDHLYVLLAVGMFEGQWRPFEDEISGLKLELADRLSRQGKGRFELADCEVKSNWVRIPSEREKRSRFLHGLTAAELTRLTDAYFDQVARRHTVIMASVVDKRFLRDGTTHETLHMTAYEFLLERIQHYMRQYHPKHRALYRDGRHEPAAQPRGRDEACRVPEGGKPEHDVSGDRRVSVLHAQRAVERRAAGRPAGLQRLSRLQGRGPGLSVFREGAGELLPAAAGNGARRTEGLAGSLAAVRAGDKGVGVVPTKNPSHGGSVMSGWANHIEPIKGTRRRIHRMWMCPCQYQGC